MPSFLTTFYELKLFIRNCFFFLNHLFLTCTQSNCLFSPHPYIVLTEPCFFSAQFSYLGCVLVIVVRQIKCLCKDVLGLNPRICPDLWLVKVEENQAVFGASALALQMRQEGFRERKCLGVTELVIHQGTHTFEREELPMAEVLGYLLGLIQDFIYFSIFSPGINWGHWNQASEN